MSFIDSYIGIVSTIEYIIQPSKLGAFIILGFDNDIDMSSLVGKFVHIVLAKHIARQPQIYEWIDSGKP